MIWPDDLSLKKIIRAEGREQKSEVRSFREYRNKLRSEIRGQGAGSEVEYPVTVNYAKVTSSAPFWHAAINVLKYCINGDKWPYNDMS